eukprot:7675691-Ditylum_brightwellii.AAC.1
MEDRLPISGGMVPVIVLLSRRSSVRFESIPTSVGMVSECCQVADLSWDGPVDCVTVKAKSIEV